MEQLTDNITLEWLDENSITFFTVGTVDRKQLDIYFERLDAIIREGDKKRIMRIVHDVSDTPLTPYVRERIRRLTNRYPDQPWQTAVIMQKSFANRIVAMMIRVLNVTNRQHETRLFFSRDDALTWLRSESTKGQDKR